MQTEMKRRVVWFSVFMIWLGMVGAILYYQESNPDILPSSADQVGNQYAAAPGENTDPLAAQNSTNQSDVTQQANPAKRPLVKEESGNADYFVQYRLDRDKARSDQISACRETINSPSTDPTTKKLNQEKILQIQTIIEQEMQVESLLKLQGYETVVALITSDNILNLVVQTDGLTEEEVAKINDTITRVTRIRAENITIIPVMKK